MITHAHFSAPSPAEIPVSSRISDYEGTVSLSQGSVVHMAFQAGKVDTVEIRKTDRQQPAALGSCKLHGPIHTDDRQLLREDLRKDEQRQDALTLLFDVGSESERKFGKLPRRQLSGGLAG